MVGVKLGEHMDRVASKVLNTPHDASSFEFHGRTVIIVGGRCSTSNVDDGVDGESGRSCSGVALRPLVLASQLRRNGRDLSITASLSEKKSIGGAASSVRRARFFHCRSKIERSAFLE